MPWHYLATVQASLIAGLVVAVALVLTKAHKDHVGRSDATKIITCALFGISVYTLFVLVVGHFLFGDLAWMVTDPGSFGEVRIAWLSTGLFADSAARLYILFDP